MSSANAFNSEWSKILLFGKELTPFTFSGEQIVTTQAGPQIFVNVKAETDVNAIATEDSLEDGYHRNSATQTETVFGLQDLPTVKDIVRKTIAKAKLKELDQAQQPSLNYGPVNGIYTCNICGKVGFLIQRKVTIALSLYCIMSAFCSTRK